MSLPGGLVDDHLALIAPVVSAVERVAPRLKTIIVIQPGSNSAQAVGSPGNYVDTPDNFTKSVRSVLKQARQHTDEVYCLGMTPVDESRVFPKENKLQNSRSYFSNSRIKLFEDAMLIACKEEEVMGIALHDVAGRAGWGNWLWRDGLHGDGQAQKWLYDYLAPELDLGSIRCA